MRFLHSVEREITVKFVCFAPLKGYSIFVIRGSLPACGAEEVLRYHPAVQSRRPRLLSDVREQSNQGTSSGGQFSQEDLQKALDRSRQMELSSAREDEDVQEAIRLSIQSRSKVKSLLFVCHVTISVVRSWIILQGLQYFFIDHHVVKEEFWGVRGG